MLVKDILIWSITCVFFITHSCCGILPTSFIY